MKLSKDNGLPRMEKEIIPKLSILPIFFIFLQYCTCVASNIKQAIRRLQNPRQTGGTWWNMMKYGDHDSVR